MNIIEKPICYIEKDILLDIFLNPECNESALYSTIMDVFDGGGVVVIESHYINAPTDILGVYYDVTQFKKRYCGLFKTLNL